MLGHAHQTGALHINAGATDAILFFDAGKITHAECGNLFGDEAVIHIIKSCVEGGQGVYKFVYGATSNQHTVLRNATDLMLDAMREYDESSRGGKDDSASAIDSLDSESSLLHSLEPSGQSDSASSRNSDSAANDDSAALDALSPDSTPAPNVVSEPVRADCTSVPATHVNTGTEEDSAAANVDSTPVAQALLPVQHDNTGTSPSPVPQPCHSERSEESAFLSDSATAVATIVAPAPNADSASSHESTPIKRSNILQSELSTYPTTITDRVLSDLRAHGDNPVDRALAELLAEQLSGNNAHALPQHTDSLSNSSEQSQDHNSNQDHVHHSDNPDQEQP